MLKNFKDSFSYEGVLLFCALGFGFFIRFFDLASQSPWTDEIASWFYLRNLDHVFLYESHTPFYYFLLRIFAGESASIYALRLISVLISCLHLVAIYLIGSRFMDRKRVIALVILMCFSPADIIYSRMARHYSLILEGTLLFYLLVKVNARTWVCALSAAALSFIHIFSLIPISVILLLEWLETKNFKRNLLIFVSSLGVIVYYLLRITMFGEQRVASNVNWVSMQTGEFILTTVTQFVGDAYPRNMFYPPNASFAYILISLLIGYLLIRRNKAGLMFIMVWILSVILVEMVDIFWANLRVNRYLVYLCSLLPLALVISVPIFTLRHLVFIFLASGSLVYSQKLTTFFPWDRETVAYWKEYSGKKNNIPKLICAYGEPNDYYELEAPYSCGEKLHTVDLKKPLLFFDLDVNNNLVLHYLTENMRPIDDQKFSHSRIIHFVPK